MSLSGVFDLSTTKTSALMAEYNALRKSKADPVRASAIASALDTRLKVIEVTPERADLLEQLVGKDKVHTFGAESVDALRTYRIGGARSTKTAYALVSEEDGKTTVLSAIYAKRIITHDHYPIFIPTLLEEKPHTFGDDADIEMQVYYSISNMDILMGAGERLIKGLMELPHQRNTLHTTISPLRTLVDHRHASGPHHLSQNMPANVLRAAAIAHLLTGTDPVQRFHLGNGARLGRILTNANAHVSEDGRDGAGVMVQWVYGDAADVDDRAKNAELFKTNNLFELLKDGIAPCERSYAEAVWRDIRTKKPTEASPRRP